MAEQQIEDQHDQQNAANSDPASVAITPIPETASEQEHEDQDDQDEVHSVIPPFLVRIQRLPVLSRPGALKRNEIGGE
jgi:hypothetical protein